MDLGSLGNPKSWQQWLDSYAQHCKTSNHLIVAPFVGYRFHDNDEKEVLFWAERENQANGSSSKVNSGQKYGKLYWIFGAKVEWDQ